MNVNVILFDDFTALDFMGPVEALQRLPGWAVNYFSLRGGLVRSKQLGIETLPAKQMEPGILLIPGKALLLSLLLVILKGAA